jgi:hypothetical protein
MIHCSALCVNSWAYTAFRFTEATGACELGFKEYAKAAPSSSPANQTTKIFMKPGKDQRPILNLLSCCPPGVNFVPYGRSYPLGVKFSVCPYIFFNSRECSPVGVNEGVNITPRGQISPLGGKL